MKCISGMGGKGIWAAKSLVDLNNDGAIDVVTANGSLWWYQNMSKSNNITKACFFKL